MTNLISMACRRAAVTCVTVGLALAGCGGGGDAPAAGNPAAVAPAALGAAAAGGTATAKSVIDQDAVTTQTAHATRLPVLAATVVDLALRATAAVHQAHPQALAAEGRARALTASRESSRGLAFDLPNLPIGCPAGGRAMLSLTAPSLGGLLNGIPDTGERYQVSFQACRLVAGTPLLDGGLTMAVSAATASTMTAAVNLDALRASVGKDMLSLEGLASVEVSTAPSPAGTLLASRLKTGRLAFSVAGSTSAAVELSDVDVALKTTLQGSTLRTDAIQGKYTLNLQWASIPFVSTVETLGEVSFSAKGTPLTGGWALYFIASRVGLLVAQDRADITVDLGNDGSNELAFTVPLAWIFPPAAS